MLRISESSASFEIVILLLEGKVSRQELEVVREACEKAIGRGSKLILDLAGVTFVDRYGVAFFQELQQRQIKLINSSPFLREQLKETASI